MRNSASEGWLGVMIAKEESAESKTMSNSLTAL